ncbi:MAG: four helix bundle protein [Caldilineaceae bacterium]
MTYEEWEQSIPGYLIDDPLWRLQVYRLALFCVDICWADVSKLSSDPRMQGLADQLYRSVGSIGANLAEGYSKSSGKDRARFYEYALGSAREAHNWYYAGRHILGQAVTDHRCGQLTSIIRLLLTMLSDQRQQNLKEDRVPYSTDPINTLDDPTVTQHAAPIN